MQLAQAMNLKKGDVLHHRDERNVDGTPQRWRVNGKPRFQATKPKGQRLRVPLKHGIYTYGAMTEPELDLLYLSVEEAKEAALLHAKKAKKSKAA